MSSLLLFLYHFFAKRKPLFVLIILSLLVASAFFASKLKLKEDIAAMMPKSSKTEKINKIFQNSRFSDKLIVNIFLQDTTKDADPELLVNFSDSLAGAIRNRFYPDLVTKVKYKVGSSAISGIFNSVYDNLPIFLTDKDYDRIDSILKEDNLDRHLKRNYKTLLSPASPIFKKFVVKDPLGISGNVLKQLQDLQVDDNYELYNSHIMTKDRKNLLLFITPANPPNETGRNSIFLAGLDSTITKIQGEYGGKIKAEYFGAVAMSVGNAERIKSDITITVTVAISVLVIFMGLFFRRATVVLIIFLPVAIGGIVSLGILYFFKGEISAIALGMGSVLLGITVDYSLHIFTHHRSTGSVKAVLKDLPIPLVMSCLITTSSFLCLLFVKSDALKDLGLFAAISVVNALVFGLLILPHFLKKPKKGQAGSHAGLSFIDKYTAYKFEKSSFLLVLIVAVTCVSFFTARKVEFETDMVKMNYVSDKLYKAEKNLLKISDLGLKSLYVVASGDSLEEALQANEVINKSVEKLVQSGVVKKVSGVNNFLISKQLQKERIDKWENFWTPEKINLAKSRLLEVGAKYSFSQKAFEPFFSSLDENYQPVAVNDFGELNDLLFDEYLSQKPSITTVSTILKVDQSKIDAVYAAVPEGNNITVLDRKSLTSRFVELMRDDFNTLEVLSLGLVFIVLVLCYGRIELGIIAFIPMALSWLWTLGIMGLLGVKFNIINIIISTFILGLGIDYSIFIMSGLMEEYKKGVQHLSSFKTSIFLSAFTSITGIGALIFAEHPALKSIAVLSIVGMFSVITISFTLQPLIFRKLITERARKGFHPYTATSLLITVFAYSYFLFGCLLLTILANLLLPVVPISLKRKKQFFHWLLCKLCKSIIYVMVNFKKEVINNQNEDFKKPAIIICNHQSFLDILLTIMLSPKVVLMTNDWVWKSPVFGRVVRYANFFPASHGVDEGIEVLGQRLKEGYSVVIFPEGTRSKSGRIGRFHKGAFLLAEKLKVDLLPIVIHGASDTLTKGDFLIKSGRVTMKILPRIAWNDSRFGDKYQQRAKIIGKYFRVEYGFLKENLETPEYFRKTLISNFLYKGPVLEWYMRIKTRLENNYELFHKLLPKEGKIVDIGCSYGFMCYMLGFLSDKREIIGIDYDSEKVEIASNCLSKVQNLSFIAADITEITVPKADAYVLSDVLHYLPQKEQDILIEKLLENLSENGILIIRDGNSDMKEKHKGTKVTEFFSVNLLRFNKSKHKLSYISESHIQQLCTEKGFYVEAVDKGKLTSNTLYVIKKAGAKTLAL